MIHSKNSSDLIASYLQTDYLISIDIESVCLRIDHYSEPLAQALKTAQQSCAAIVSAYNPQSKLRSDEENTRAHQLLQKSLTDQQYDFCESLHNDPVGQWPIEKGYFVTGMHLDDARAIGQEFNQKAIVWISGDAIPRLILLN